MLQNGGKIIGFGQGSPENEIVEKKHSRDTAGNSNFKVTENYVASCLATSFTIVYEESIWSMFYWI